jgi:hypothetical protein
MPNPLNEIRKNGVYTLLTPDESGLLVGHLEGRPVAYFFSKKRNATAFRTAIGKANFPIVKEDAKELTQELVESGVVEAFVDPDEPKTLPDPLNLKKYLEVLEKAAV